MAFTPNVDYVGHQRLRQDALGQVTKAKLQTKLRKEEEERRAAAARAASKKKSGFGQKLVGAVARGAAAYYTGGLSETTGLGAMVDQQIQGGSDYERNEWGDIAGAAVMVGKGMDVKTAGAAAQRLTAQSAKDDAMQARMDKISPEAGLAYAQKREAKDSKNWGILNDYKSGFLNFGKDIDGLDLSATTMDYSGITKDKKVGKTPAFVETEEGPPGGPIVIEEATPDAASEGFEGKESAPDSGFIQHLQPVDQTSTNLPSNQNENFRGVMSASPTATNLGPEDQRDDIQG